MARSRGTLIGFIVLFVVLYAVFNGHLFGYGLPGHGLSIVHIGWFKWLVLGLVIWAVIGSCSTSPRRRRRNRYYDDSDSSYSSSVYSSRHDSLQEQLNELRGELSTLKSDNVAKKSSSMEAKIDSLAERIQVLEKIVTSRRYQLDDEFDNL